MRKGSWMTVLEWIWRVVAINFCWIGFTILGLGIFGFFPASVALFTIVRKWLNKDTDAPLLKTFSRVYFKEWKRTNGIALVYYALGIFLFIDIRIVMELMTGMFSIFLLVFLYGVSILLVLSVGYFFALYAHYELSTKDYIRQSFFHAATNISSTIMIGAGLFMVGFLLFKFPGLLLFISGVAPAYFVMVVCMNRFQKLEKMISLQ
ncbi:YesL family protein [Sporosarcina sp. YIM B06819]|uniref:YesL family protein n=1 Tax=Sporosarcina sp. YIM B06819 TaxID=3081769 RepID=UPI00298C0DD2|nr:DUF624 domain-containing protein [Sporosarcina sp. YIM B06819]